MLLVSMCVVVSTQAAELPCYSYDADHAKSGVDLLLSTSFLVAPIESSELPWLGGTQNEFQPLITEGNLVDLAANRYWFRVCVDNKTSDSIQLKLVANPPVLNKLDFYHPGSTDKIIKTGFVRPFSSRGNLDREFNFDISMPAHGREIYYISVQAPNLSTLGINLDLWNAEDFAVHSKNDNTFKLVQFGIFMALFIYHLMLYATTKNRTLLLFVVASGFGFLTFYGANGFIFQYVLADYPQWNRVPLLIVSAVVVLAVVLYIVNFLRLPQLMPKLTRGVYWVLGISSLVAAVLWPYTYWYLAFVMFSGLLVMPLFIITAGIYSYYKYGSDQAIALVAIVIPSVFYLLSGVGFAQFGFGLEFALVISMLFFSIAMGHQFTQIRKDKAQTQRQVETQSEEIAALSEQNRAELQSKVQLRTVELEEKVSALEDLTQELRSKDKTKSEFFANISHKFRTPLTLIQGPLERFAKGANNTLSTEYQAEADIALRNTKQLRILVEQLLELVKIEDNRQVLRVSEMDICEFVRSQVTPFDVLCKHRDINLQLRLPDVAVMLYFDADKMQKIINNLLSNALKFTPKGGEINFIINECELGDVAFVELVVVDTGVGIADKDIPYVFDRFYQGDRSENQISEIGSEIGIGIGLALVKELVLLQGGKIQLLSQLNHGSTFKLSFPTSCDHYLPEEIVSHHKPNGVQVGELLPSTEQPIVLDRGAKVARKQHTVLVVDDSADMRSYLTSRLAEHYNVDVAVNGLEGLKLAMKLKPDLIISDDITPEMDGVSLLKKIRENPSISYIPVVLISALTERSERLIALRAHADEYLVKPFDIEELVVRVANLIERSHRPASSSVARPSNNKTLSGSEQAAPSEKQDFLTKLYYQIETHIGDDTFDVDRLASLMFMSKATLYRHIEAAAIESPASLIREARMDRARHIFETDGAEYQSIAQVAEAVGIKKVANFTRMYRKSFNKAPLFESRAASE